MMTRRTALLAACFAAVGCGNGLADDADLANATGDTMANLDEAAIGSGMALRELPLRRAPGFLRPDLKHRVLDAIFPAAYAASCWTEPFSACTADAETRTFSNCDVGLDTIDGTVTLTFSDSTCALSSAGDSVTRTGNFTATGFEGGTLTVSSPGGGQQLTNNGAGAFSYDVLGMERVAVRPNGDQLFDISTSTSAPIGVTGLTRATRVANGGTLVVQHNLAKYTATLTPNDVTWAATCNCAVSGSFTGTLSGSRTGSYALELTGCGTANLTVGTVTESIELDRCGTL